MSFLVLGAVAYSLREKKDFDFKLKVVGSEVSTIPGISDAIEETIGDAMEDSIMWPVRKIIPILPGDYSFHDMGLKWVLQTMLQLIALVCCWGAMCLRCSKWMKSIRAMWREVSISLQ
ncbi:hypothetical protein J1N35_015138 [Gossypium stocksii]|uniref:Uncharacterized protein n=1 Tax=Gossypium stocksii TaxID=47602 RepID=A0A9D3VVQ8_9ROSI|nr:hypothetical protein J1N35_015138 [Gossypium stocksii]